MRVNEADTMYRKAAPDSAEPLRSTTSEPTYGDDNGQRQPSQDGERPDEAGKPGPRQGHEPPRVVEADPRGPDAHAPR
jgi:hypothetical protein